MKNKVNLFLVGAMKAGTTSFADLLSKHPEIYFSPIKEPHHFITDTPKEVFPQEPTIDLKKYLDNEILEPLHLEIVKGTEDYNRLFKNAQDEKYLAEGSTGYYHSFESAEMIHQYNPDAKILILNRNPIKRAYSHYKMDTGLGRITKDFETVISSEIEDYELNGLNRWNHLGMSLYSENTKRFKKYFGKNVYVIDFETFVKDQTEELNKLYDFLGLNPVQISLQHSNSSKEIKYKKIVSFLFKTGLKDIGSKLLPKSVRTFVFNKMQSKSKEMKISTLTLTKFNEIVKANSK